MLFEVFIIHFALIKRGNVSGVKIKVRKTGSTPYYSCDLFQSKQALSLAIDGPGGLDE